MPSRKRFWSILAVLTATGAFAFMTSRTSLQVVERTSGESVSAQQLAAVSLQGGATASSVQWPERSRVRFSEWTSVASDNLAAGVQAITASGDLLYALGEVGNIYVSADGAATWKQVAHVRQASPGNPLTMGQLLVLPAQGTRPITFFMADRSSWPTFYRLREGDTQVIVPGNPARHGDTSVRQMVLSGQTVYVATDTGVFRSDDGGDSWQLALQTDYACGSLVASGTTVYVRCDSYGPVDGLYRSVNGAAFTRMSNDLALRWASLAVSPSNANVLYAASTGAFMRSLDGGATWTKTIDFYEDPDPMNRALGSSLESICAQGVSGDVYAPAFAVDPTNPNVVWVGQEQLFRSDDGGAHFGRANIQGVPGQDPLALPGGMSQVLFRGNSLHVVTRSGIHGTSNRHAAVQAGGVAACTNPGPLPQFAWAPQNQGINGQQFIKVAVSGDGSVLATTQRETLHYSDLDNPGGWLPMSTEWPRAIVVDADGGIDRFYGVGCGTNACRWDFDAGQGIWQKTSVAAFGFGGMGVLITDPSDRDRVWAQVGQGIYRSNDALASGTVYLGNPGCVMEAGAVSPTDPNLLIMASGWCGGVIRKSNALSLQGEVEWPMQRLRTDNWIVNELAFDRTMPQRVFMIGNKAPSIYISPDTGLTWRALDAPGAQDGLPDGDVRTFVTDPENSDVMYIGGKEGLFVNWNLGAAGSEGQTWHEVPTPFRGANIQKLAIRMLPDGTRRLFVYTQGAGLWTTTIDVARFGDVVFDDWSYDFVKRLQAAGVTNGCSAAPISYCPQQPVLREQMAAFLLRAMHGGSYQPPARSGSFADVPAGHWAVNWIEQLRLEGITTGCATDPARYCPGDVVPREQIAVFLLRAKRGASYEPPPAVGLFADVPSDSWAAAWIEQLSREGIANGCSVSPAKYCPADPVTREQMAAFLVRAFNL